MSRGIVEKTRCELELCCGEMNRNYQKRSWKEKFASPRNFNVNIRKLEEMLISRKTSQNGYKVSLG